MEGEGVVHIIGEDRRDSVGARRRLLEVYRGMVAGFRCGYVKIGRMKDVGRC